MTGEHGGSTQGDATVIYSRLLSGGAGCICGVSTRRGGVSPGLLGMNLSYRVGDVVENVRENRRRFFGHFSISESDVAFQRQVHGETARVVRDAGTYDDCDALITDAAGLGLAVSVADCLPIFLADRRKKVIAAVHSGWRGSIRKIALRALERMQLEFGCDADDMQAFIGPAASVCCYEVGEDVAELLPEEYRAPGKGTRPHIDLKRYNRDLLLTAGLAGDCIETSGLCTICSPALLHSFRRDGDRSGRMLGVIMMRPD